MGKLGPEQHTDKKQDYGPTWGDVHDLWQWIEKELDIRLELHGELTRSVNNRVGVRYVFVSKETRVVLGGVGFGPAFTSSPRTLPAGLMRALYDVQHAAEERKSKGLPADHPGLFDGLGEGAFFSRG